MIEGIIIYFVSLVLNIILLVWWRCSCEWCGFHHGIHFPTRGHTLILILIALIPIINIIELTVLAGVYIGMRLTEQLVLKENKFNKFWFDIGKEEKKN